MTGKALDLLAKNSSGKRKGFFLQVESASIDQKDHGADACGQIGETEQMDEAVTRALDFARKDGTSATQQPTGSQVRVAGHGPAVANVVGLIDQTDLFFVMRNALGINRR